MSKKGYLNQLGIINIKNEYRNLSPAKLVEMALAGGEGILAANGALRVETGKYTGRSPEDRFIVDSKSTHDNIEWGSINQPISETAFNQLYLRLTAYLQGKDLFVFDGYCGADPQYRMPITVVNEYAWQNLFAHQLFVRPQADELANHEPKFTLICAPGFKAVPELDGTYSEAFIILNFDKRVIIIGGSSYAGEIKKSIFTAMNYLLPEQGICPMHCSANISSSGESAIFFGLSGTGKTTLSADPERFLIGDDEHGWTDQGIFNFEGGCYAKCINLSQEYEPQIWNAIRFGSVVENVIIDPESREADYNSEAITENTRAAYPVDYIPNAVIPGVGGHPKTIIFLTADAFGVMPPIARLTPEQAMYHFLSGYTSKLAGTERGITEPKATFSTGFGGPFLPRRPLVYAELLREKIKKFNTQVYLVNTGWTGGPYGVGQRMNLKYTRAMVSVALHGGFAEVEFKKDPIFNIEIPQSCPDVPAELLNPKNTWSDPGEYDIQARKLALLFKENFNKFKGMSETVIAAGPTVD